MFQIAKKANRQRWKVYAREMTRKKKHWKNRTEQHLFHSRRFNFENLNLCGHNIFVWTFFLFHMEKQYNVITNIRRYIFISILWINGRFCEGQCCRFAYKIDTEHSFSFLRIACQWRSQGMAGSMHFKFYSLHQPESDISTQRTYFIRLLLPSGVQ